MKIDPVFVHYCVGPELLKALPYLDRVACPPRINEVDNVNESVLKLFLAYCDRVTHINAGFLAENLVTAVLSLRR